MDDLETAARRLREADTAVAFTGAGVSAPSGVPPFRGEGGIWNEYDPDAFDVRAARSGATLILVNLDETPLDSRADRTFREDVTDVLPALRDAAVA